MKIFTLDQHGHHIELVGMKDPTTYLRNALTRKIFGQQNKYATLGYSDKNIIDNEVSVFGVLYALTRGDTETWVSLKQLCKIFCMTQEEMCRYLNDLLNTSPYQGAGHLIDYYTADSEYFVQVYNVDVKDPKEEHPTIKTAENEYFSVKYNDTPQKKDTTPQTIKRFDEDYFEKDFKELVKTKYPDLFSPKKCVISGTFEIHFGDGATALF